MKVISCIAVSFFLNISFIQAQSFLPYRNPKLSVEDRTSDLLSRMTLEEKVGQLLCPLGWEMYEKQGNKVSYSKKYEKLLQDRHIGMLWGVYRADPWTKKTLENGLDPQLAAEAGNALQRYVMEHTRLGIPVFLAEECPHGHMAIGTTVFPTGIGLAASWSPQLLEKVGSVISKELRLQGGHIAYGPVLDLVRDPRWGRVEETFGEDQVLSAALVDGMIKGEGEGDLTKPNSVITTLKHFIAYGIPEGGQNGNSSHVGIRELHERFLPPFKSAIDAGALSVMTSYNSIDGIPCTGNSYLLTSLLRDEWKFRGLVVSDLYSIEGLHGGLQISFQAFKNATANAPLQTVDGFTPEQRFFLSYAGVWAGNIRPEAILSRTKSDPHSLGKWRVNGALPQIGACCTKYNSSR